jgi:hypothetical protein
MVSVDGAVTGRLLPRQKRVIEAVLKRNSGDDRSRNMGTKAPGVWPANS